MRHWVVLVSAIVSTLSMTLMLMVSAASVTVPAQHPVPPVLSHHASPAAPLTSPVHSGQAALDCATLHSALLLPATVWMPHSFLLPQNRAVIETPPSLTVAPLLEPPRHTA